MLARPVTTPELPLPSRPWRRVSAKPPSTANSDCGKEADRQAPLPTLPQESLTPTMLGIVARRVRRGRERSRPLAMPGKL
jgi:hypothetical protein